MRAGIKWLTLVGPNHCAENLVTALRKKQLEKATRYCPIIAKVKELLMKTRSQLPIAAKSKPMARLSLTEYRDRRKLLGRDKATMEIKKDVL